jgi:hypothetical protein
MLRRARSLCVPRFRPRRFCAMRFDAWLLHTTRFHVALDTRWFNSTSFDCATLFDSRLLSVTEVCMTLFDLRRAIRFDVALFCTGLLGMMRFDAARLIDSSLLPDSLLAGRRTQLALARSIFQPPLDGLV